MEDFTRTQLVLLGVFISFITSMVTGVVVVSLMRQEPTGVVQTINRVVERTVEKVVPAEKEIITETEVITKEVVTEVVIKESDLIASAVQTGIQGLFSLHLIDDVGDTTLGSGFVLTSEGIMVTDAQLFEKLGEEDTTEQAMPELYIEYGEYTVPVELVLQDELNDIALLKPVPDVIDNDGAVEAATAITYTPLVFADVDALQLGQAVIALDGAGSGNVSKGIISSLDVGIVADAVTEDYVGQLNYILTDIRLEATGAGGPLLSLDGEVVGLNSIDAGSGVIRAVPTHKIEALLAESMGDVSVEEETEDKLAQNLTE